MDKVGTPVSTYLTPHLRTIQLSPFCLAQWPGEVVTQQVEEELYKLRLSRRETVGGWLPLSGAIVRNPGAQTGTKATIQVATGTHDPARPARGGRPLYTIPLPSQSRPGGCY